jgi:hypothetical protein
VVSYADRKRKEGKHTAKIKVFCSVRFTCVRAGLRWRPQLQHSISGGFGLSEGAMRVQCGTARYANPGVW